MIYWKSVPDENNPGQWKIINDSTKKTIVYGLSQRDAEAFADRRNKQQEKRSQG